MWRHLLLICRDIILPIWCDIILVICGEIILPIWGTLYWLYWDSILPICGDIIIAICEDIILRICHYVINQTTTLSLPSNMYKVYRSIHIKVLIPADVILAWNISLQLSHCFTGTIHRKTNWVLKQFFNHFLPHSFHIKQWASHGNINQGTK